jgi:hypothetical protein
MIVFLFIGGIVYMIAASSSTKDTAQVQSTIQSPPVLGAQTKTGLDADKLWSLIQDWRTKNNINTIVKDDRLCDYANNKLKSLKAFWEDEVSLDRKYFKDGQATINFSRNIATEQGVVDTWLSTDKTKQNMSAPYQYGCAVTDGNYSVFLIANLNTASVGLTPTVASDQQVMCAIDAACGGGYKQTTKSACDKMICCVLGDRAYLYDDKDKCQQDIKQVEKNTSVYECQQNAQKEYDNRKGECDSKKDDQSAYTACLQAIYDSSNQKYKDCSK